MLICSPIHRRLGCLHFLANKTSLNICINTCFHFSRVNAWEWNRSYRRCTPSLLRNCQTTFTKWSHHLTFPHWLCARLSWTASSLCFVSEFWLYQTHLPLNQIPQGSVLFHMRAYHSGDQPVIHVPLCSASALPLDCKLCGDRVLSGCRQVSGLGIQ